MSISHMNTLMLYFLLITMTFIPGIPWLLTWYQSDTVGMKIMMLPLPIQKLMKMKNMMMQFSRLLLLRYRNFSLSILHPTHDHRSQEIKQKKILGKRWVRLKTSITDTISFTRGVAYSLFFATNTYSFLPLFKSQTTNVSIFPPLPLSKKKKRKKQKLHNTTDSTLSQQVKK